MPHAPLIDGFEFARGSGRLTGSKAAKDLRRLRESLLGAEGTVEYGLHGLPEVQGRPALRLEVRARLALQCQRCLGRLEVEVRSEALLLLYADEAELASHRVEVEGPERIVAGREMAVLDLVEDEVLLAIPYAPHHEHCSTLEDEPRRASQRPFAALRELIAGRR